MSLPVFLKDAPRFVFFTGKGGVGKTSLACATAVHLAGEGAKVLLVSTDPASNVAQVVGQKLGNDATAVDAVPGLWAREIDPHAAAEAYREKVVGPVRDILPAKEIESITEQLSGSCTTEIASFNEFTDLLADDEALAEFDHVVFDTAPTGHTIRLLQLPGEWTTFLDNGKGDASCLGPMSGLDKSKAAYASAVERLADPQLTRLVLVARAQTGSLDEAARTAKQLADVGISQQHLVVNAVLGDAGDDTLAGAVREREQRALATIPGELEGLPRTVIPLKPVAPVGLDALRCLLADDAAAEAVPVAKAAELNTEAGLQALVDELANQDHGLVMCMGKGGVGKSTVAAAIALALAAKGHKVHLSTTDPAAHLDQILSGASGDNLTVSRIDPHEATEAYRARVLASKGAHLDDAGKALLAEDLQSPCTEEVAVFGEFSKLVSEARRSFVVVDTAPTGHTLLLMDATGSYHREIMRGVGETGKVVTPMMRLQDADLTKMIVVTLPEATPVQEAADLTADLERANITPWAWVVNQSLAAADVTHPVLAARAGAEVEHIRRAEDLAARLAVIPVMADEPTGEAGLTSLLA